jgi:lycopene beta-cyclase
MVNVDYIIAGGGAAGLSLALRMMDSATLREKQIVIIDKDSKDENDRTWCFWEYGKGYYDSILFHQWQQLRIDGDGAKLIRNIAPYHYKMLRAKDFYAHAKLKLEKFSNIRWVQANIESMGSLKQGAFVKTNQGEFHGAWCFSSISEQEIDKNKNHYLDQHFRGWFIKTKEAVFNKDEAHFMDFRTPQNGETRFLYVLPYKADEALVEIAIFSRNHLLAKQYNDILETYLRKHWNLDRKDYDISQEEEGNIPMTDALFKKSEGSVIYLGMAGGDTRASTGFTFLNIQRRVDKIIKSLQKGNHPGESRQFDRFRWYDSVLLRVLEEKRYGGEQLFMRLFKKNPIQRILAFLQGDSRLNMEIKVMQTAPLKEFFMSALRIMMGIKISR